MANPMMGFIAASITGACYTVDDYVLKYMAQFNKTTFNQLRVWTDNSDDQTPSNLECFWQFVNSEDDEVPYFTGGLIPFNPAYGNDWPVLRGIQNDSPFYVQTQQFLTQGDLIQRMMVKGDDNKTEKVTEVGNGIPRADLWCTDDYHKDGLIPHSIDYDGKLPYLGDGPHFISSESASRYVYNSSAIDRQRSYMLEHVAKLGARAGHIEDFRSFSRNCTSLVVDAKFPSVNNEMLSHMHEKDPKRLYNKGTFVMWFLPKFNIYEKDGSTSIPFLDKRSSVSRCLKQRMQFRFFGAQTRGNNFDVPRAPLGKGVDPDPKPGGKEVPAGTTSAQAPVVDAQTKETFNPETDPVQSHMVDGEWFAAPPSYASVNDVLGGLRLGT